MMVAPFGTLGTFSPGMLPLTLWLQEYPAFVFTEKWTSNATAQGAAAGRDLYHGASSPSNGATLNGHRTASFDGTYTSDNSLEGAAPFSRADVMSVNQWWMAFLFKPSLVNAPGDNPTADPYPWASRALVEDVGYGTFCLSLDTAGLHALVADGTVDVDTGGYKRFDANLPCANNAWHYAIMWFDRSHINLELDGVTSTVATSGAPMLSSGTYWRLGDSYSTAHYGGLIAEVMVSDCAQISQHNHFVRAYFNTRYAQNL